MSCTKLLSSASSSGKVWDLYLSPSFALDVASNPSWESRGQPAGKKKGRKASI